MILGGFQVLTSRIARCAQDFCGGHRAGALFGRSGEKVAGAAQLLQITKVLARI